jgi:hypothetical protein
MHISIGYLFQVILKHRAIIGLMGHPFKTLTIIIKLRQI